MLAGPQEYHEDDDAGRRAKGMCRSRKARGMTRGTPRKRGRCGGTSKQVLFCSLKVSWLYQPKCRYTSGGKGTACLLPTPQTRGTPPQACLASLCHSHLGKKRECGTVVEEVSSSIQTPRHAGMYTVPTQRRPARPRLSRRRAVFLSDLSFRALLSSANRRGEADA